MRIPRRESNMKDETKIIEKEIWNNIIQKEEKLNLLIIASKIKS